MFGERNTEEAPLPAGSLPQNDDVGVLTRVVSVVCLIAVPCLILLHLLRICARPEMLTWQLPAVFLAAVVLADFVSGLVHWAADTWGSEEIPVLGRRFLRPFRVHHVNPEDFLRRRFIDTNGDVAMLVLPVVAMGFLIPLTEEVYRWAAVLLVAFCAGILPTNQVHQWAHMTEPPAPVRRLQACGLLLGHRQHQMHHAPPYAMNYCITTGWCNRPLTAMKFFPALERVISRLTGMSPRSEDRLFAARVEQLTATKD